MRLHLSISLLLLVNLSSACKDSIPDGHAHVETDSLERKGPNKAAPAAASRQDSKHQQEIDSLYGGQVPGPATGYYGSFAGDEPFWSIEFKGKTLVWENYEQAAVEEPVTFSVEASRGFQVAFRSEQLFGIVVRSIQDTCMYAVTEEPYLPMDICFSVNGKTYAGCGILRGVDLRRG